MSNPSREAIGSVVDQLWSIALRIEDGDLPEAERELKSAQDAIVAGAARRMPRPRRSSSSSTICARRCRDTCKLSPSRRRTRATWRSRSNKNGDQLVSQQELDKMLSNIEKLAQSGSKEMAERMLSELKDILERMQAGNIPENAKQQRASRMMKDLNDVISKQQKLLDDTFEAKRQQGGTKAASRASNSR